MTIKSLLASRAKLVAYAVGIAAALVSAGVLHGNALAIALAVETLATGAGIHQIPNVPVPPKAA